MMIFQYTLDKVLTGEKTQTRRLALREPDGTKVSGCEMISYPMGQMAVVRGSTDDSRWNIRWQVGKTYAVQTSRGKAGLWWNEQTKQLANEVIEYIPTFNGYHSETDYDNPLRIDHSKAYRAKGLTPVRIRVLSIRREDVRDISDDDVKAEGFDSKGDFWYTWIEMHDKSFLETFRYAHECDYLREYGFYERPAKRYDAWVLEFELVKGE